MSRSSWCTVVIPTFNGERYLPDLIDSLKRLKHGFDVSWLFIDDASTDESVKIIRQSGLEPAIVIENSHNMGLYPTINKSMSVVSSEYIALIFQDDVVSDRYLEQMKGVVKRYPQATFLWPAIDIIDEAGTLCTRGLDTGRIEVILPCLSAWRDALNRGTFWTISGSISKTEALRRYGFSEDLPHCGDFEFLLRTIRSEVFLYFERPLIKIRTHSDQASARNLRTSADLREHIDIYRRQKTANAKEFDIALQLQLLRKSFRAIIMRALGQAKRGEVSQAYSTLMLLRGRLSVFWK